MHRFITMFASLGLVTLLAGCAGVAASSLAPSLLSLPGGAALDMRTQTDVKLAEPNFVMVKTNVFGESRGFSLLGLISIVPPSFNTAFGRLHAQANIESGKAQVLANIIFERDSSYWILFSLPRYSVRADVVEFVRADPEVSPQRRRDAETGRAPENNRAK